MAESHPSRLIHILRKFLILVLGLICGCLIAEVLLRRFGDQELSLMQKDLVLGQIYKPNLETKVYQEESQEWINIQINSLGFRDNNHTPGKSSAKRVLILGDSYAAAFSVELEHTFARLIEKYLRQRTNDHWEVINLGVAGFGTAQEVVAYEQIGRKFHPDYVILCFFSGNDVSDNSSELSTNPRLYFRVDNNGELIREPVNIYRSRASSFLNENSHLYLWQKNQFRKLENYYKYKVSLNPAYRVFLADYDGPTIRAWQITKALLHRLKSRVEKDDSKLLLVYIPFPDELYPDWWQETVRSSPPMQEEKWDTRKPEREISSYAAEERLNLLTPFAGQPGTSFYFKHGHFNRDGHRKMAEEISAWILRN